MRAKGLLNEIVESNELGDFGQGTAAWRPPTGAKGSMNTSLNDPEETRQNADAAIESYKKFIERAKAITGG